MIQKVVLVDSFAPVMPYDEDKERDNKLNRLLVSMNLKGVVKGGLSLDTFWTWFSCCGGVVWSWWSKRARQLAGSVIRRG
jgi:hypothetical protein